MTWNSSCSSLFNVNQEIRSIYQFVTCMIWPTDSRWVFSLTAHGESFLNLKERFNFQTHFWRSQKKWICWAGCSWPGQTSPHTPSLPVPLSPSRKQAKLWKDYKLRRKLAVVQQSLFSSSTFDSSSNFHVHFMDKKVFLSYLIRVLHLFLILLVQVLLFLRLLRRPFALCHTNINHPSQSIQEN